MTIEPMRWWHIDELLSIEQDLFGAERWSAGMFWNELANGHHYVVAIEDTAVVGYAGVALTPSGEAWINNIAVRRDRQHRGIGRALLDHLLATAHDGGADEVLLEVASDNVPAQRLYDAYGFEAIGVRRGYYQPSNTDAVVMRRERL